MNANADPQQRAERLIEQRWSQLLARINGRYGTEFWAMAYANNPLWHMEREELDHRLLEPIGVEACLATLEQWPDENDPIWTGGAA